jgi:hypothetical protein
MVVIVAVVQTGSSTRRSACITARNVRAGAGAARAMRTAGAWAAANAASPPVRMPRRVVVMSAPACVVPPSRAFSAAIRDRILLERFPIRLNRKAL